MKFTENQIKQRRIKRLAEMIHDHWEENSGMDTRYFDNPYIHDVYVVDGQSTEGGTYREHVVPRVYLRDRCLEMYENKAAVEEEAETLLANLRIVKITKDQAEALNKKLRETMPDGWVLGKDDPLERLYSLGIQVA